MSILKRLNVILLTAVVVLLVAFVLDRPTVAGIVTGWDWPNDPKTGNPKRKLKIFVGNPKEKLGDRSIDDIMNDATKNWNREAGNTGWEFDRGTATDFDIFVQVSGIAHNAPGGALTSTGTGTVTHEVMSFDPTPAGFKWDRVPLDPDKTKNPVSAAMHELSHTMRLDHQGSTRSMSMKIKDPQGAATKNDDVLKPSPDDIQEAKKASTEPLTRGSSPGGPGHDANISIPGFNLNLPFSVKTPDATLHIPSSAFLNQSNVSMIAATSTPSLPDPFNVPNGFGRMVKGVFIDVTGVSGPPLLTKDLFTLTIPYEDGKEGEGHLIDIADPDYGSILESSLQPFVYEPLSRAWNAIDPFSMGGSYFLDTTNDFAQLMMPSDFLLSEGGSLYIALSGQIPEPSSVIMFSTGILGLLLGSVWRHRSAAS